MQKIWLFLFLRDDSLKINLIYLLHFGSDLGVGRLVDFVIPVNRNFNPLIELKDDHGIMEVSK